MGFILCCLKATAASIDQDPTLARLKPEISVDSSLPVRSHRLSLTQSVDIALRNFPSLREAQARLGQRDYGITLQKTAYLPQLNLLVQELRTTTNVVSGAIFPQTLDVIPMQTGKETHSSSFNSVWADNLGANFSWELYDFGLRHANVLTARAQRNSAFANLQLTQLDVADGAAMAYLQAVAAKATIAAQAATVRRMEAWQLVVHTLVDRGLRPGVDTARSDADLAESRIKLIDAQRDTELAEVDLAEALGEAGGEIDVIDDPWMRKPTVFFTAPPLEVANHPLAILRSNEVLTAHAEVHSWERTWYPHLWWHSGIWGRGSGTPGDARTTAGGVVPQTGNWVAGLSMSFAVFDYFSVKAQKHEAVRNEQAERANYDLAVQILMQKDARARVLLDKSRKIVVETEYLLTSAQENEKKALERYRVGLSNIVEVAEAEEILERAELANAMAEVRVWQAILAIGYAQGDLKPFLQLAHLAEGTI
jgi:outer membrane protein TolC